jgi:hypothetical protein
MIMNCTQQGPSCKPVKKQLTGSDQYAFGCQCQSNDYDLKHDVQVFSNFKKISDVSAVFTFSTLQHPVFIGLVCIGVVVLGLLMFKEEYLYKKYELPPDGSKTWGIFIALLYTHPLFGIFLTQNEEMSPRKLLMLYYARLLMEAGFSSFFQLGTDYTDYTTSDELIMSSITAVCTKTINKMLMLLLSFDPNSPNFANDYKKAGTKVVTLAKLRVFIGGGLTVFVTIGAYYCIVAISLQASADEINSWVRMVLFSVIQDQVLTHVIMVSASIGLIQLVVNYKNFRYRDKVIKVMINPELADLFEEHLHPPLSRRGPVSPRA